MHLKPILNGLAILALLFICSCARNADLAGSHAPPPSYTNPVYAGSMPDPSVIQYRGVYYAFGTTGPGRKSDGRIFTLLRSTNLVNWEELGGALLPPFPEKNRQYWAPEAAENNGRFYLYYSVGGLEPEKFELRVAASDRPEG